eukprot:TRINITY_DN854_c0_g1_i1.p1 TRINITY_DN854_c0_g1~~TRINITY_DN854_c0_g1_i1.p1  ORF type:complete len:398 (+),score=109.74 TRINITY_DN854_c0_g1_i1:93-1286(+)
MPFFSDCKIFPTLFLGIVFPVILSFFSFSIPSSPSEMDRVIPHVSHTVHDAVLRSLPHNTNIVLSPFSVQCALSLALDGAAGDTEKELARIIEHNANSKAETDAFLTKHGHLFNISRPGLRLATANGILVGNPIVSKEYISTLKRKYNSDVFFAAENPVKQVNDWVGEKTMGKITELIKTVPANTACILLNAVYFKGDWEKQFNKEKTAKKPFTNIDGTISQVDMMHEKIKGFGVVKTPTHTALALAYKGKDVAMVITMANKGNEGLSGVIAIPHALDSHGEAIVSMPRFKVESTINDELIAALQSLGVINSFKPSTADFSAMGGAPGDIWIDSVIQKAVIEVGEEGTIASVASAYYNTYCSMPREPRVFTVDRPFEFFVVDVESQMVLFSGKVNSL